MRINSMVRSIAGGQRGFALLEVLLALGLSSVMLLVLYNAQRHNQAVLVYSQQLYHANQLLLQVASQVWAYPQHYFLLSQKPQVANGLCLAGQYCNPTAMAQAWALYWQQQYDQHMPEGELKIACDRTCAVGHSLSIRLTWHQPLAVASGECLAGVACLSLNIKL